LGRDFDTMLSWLKEKVLSSSIEKATLSTRLVESSCALVATQYGYSGNMERIMKSQAYAKAGGDGGMNNQKRIMEMNPFHPLVQELNRLHKADPESEHAADLAQSLYDTALLRSGFSLKDTTSFSARMDKLLRRSFNVDATATVEIPAELDEEVAAPAEDAVSEEAPAAEEAAAPEVPEEAVSEEPVVPEAAKEEL